MEKITFTPDEANALLPQLKADLFKLQELTTQFETEYSELQERKALYKEASVQIENDPDPFFERESKLEFLKMEADMLIGNFARKGVLLKMINPGLIDFPAIVDGEEVLICWKEGETSITHYHGWHDGFIGRKPLPEE
ncbi:DUF2203 domain-containing protein [Paenibacillus nasutitermitis]|uniref:Cell division protein DivIVA n=1 Tax=Paenibacillus nasutitermitis TaxID=1652958 RepID=A0A917DQP1_9BACL|nr:DUF2203 domain-containing protein [Paenibacillus nasutitermitis]GGD57563.1 hypothetical protein GCM10010911_14230 [Paenibacillus nasutitermitis]